MFCKEIYKNLPKSVSSEFHFGCDVKKNEKNKKKKGFSCRRKKNGTVRVPRMSLHKWKTMFLHRYYKNIGS